jgi:type I restriction enzyme S subunit
MENIIPKEWIECKLCDIAKWGSGGTPKSDIQEYYNGEIPWIIIGDLNDSYIYSSTKKITELGLKNSSAKMVKPDSILIAMYGSIGKLGINKIPLATNQAIAFTEILFSGTFNIFLFYYLLFVRKDLINCGKGGTQSNISQTVLKDFDFILPPLAEQKEIVKRIEELFSDLDNGVESLKKAKEQIKIYRQSVLKNAFEGKLTEKWREENPDKLESPEILLEKIKQAREEHYQKQMEEWEQKIKEWEEKGKEGKKPIKPRPPKLFSKLTEDDFEGISTLPFNWIWEKLGNITFLITDGTHLKPDYTEFGVPFLSVKNVRPNIIKDEDIKYISIEQHSEYIRRCKVEPRDILYTKVGATYGYAAINNLNYDFSIYVSLCLIKYPQQIILPKFISYCMNSKIIYNQAQKRIKGIGRPDLHLEEISEFYFPLVSIEEQQKIVIEIEDKMSVCDKMEEAIDEDLKKAELLRQSILKKAFSGELTKEWRKNNPDLITGENSAENLLKKIKAEKEAQK